MRNSNKGNEWHNFLNHQNKLSLSNFNSVQRKKIPKAPEKINDIIDKQKSNEFSNLLKKKLQENDADNRSHKQYRICQKRQPCAWNMNINNSESFSLLIIRRYNK